MLFSVLPCKDDPPPAPPGGWSWFEFKTTKYMCPNGYEFEGGQYPFWQANCTAKRTWNPPVAISCVPRKCLGQPPNPFMGMDRDWPHERRELGTVIQYTCPFAKMTSTYNIGNV